MLTAKNLAIVTVLAFGTATPGLAAAERRQNVAWLQLGDVGTHTHDAEDYVTVRPVERIERLQLRARGGTVALDGVKIQFVNGRTAYVEAHRRLRPGEAMMIDVPRGGAIKMLVLDYGNAGPYWRALETAHLQVLGLVIGGHDDEPRSRSGRYWTTEPTRDTGTRLEWRGGIRVRVR